MNKEGTGQASACNRPGEIQINLCAPEAKIYELKDCRNKSLISSF